MLRWLNKINWSYAIFTLMAAVIGRSVAWADVVDGNAFNKLPGYQARGANEISSVGAVAPSLQGKPLVVRIHADWCPACKATQPTINELKSAYGTKINFVQFNVTNASTATASQALAQKLGLDKFYSASKTATSTVAVINPQNGQVYATLYNDGKLADYEAAVDRVLKAEGK